MVAVGLMGTSAIADTKGWVEQKAALVDRFLGQSQSLQRAANQDGAVIGKTVTEIKALRERAEKARLNNDVALAGELLDQAFRLVLEVSRKGADPSGGLIVQKARFEDHLAAVTHFEQVYQRHLAAARQVGQPGRESGESARRIEEWRDLVRQAQTEAAANRLEAANHRLDRAYRLVVDALKSFLDSQTLVYELKFETKADEFRYEQERGSGLEALLRMALNQKAAGEVKADEVQRLVESATKMRGEAEGQAARGDHAAAVGTIEKANGLLGQALRATGMMMPF